MLRGFRWQLLVFVTALVLFVIALLSRTNAVTSPSPTATHLAATPTDSATVSAITETAAPTPTANSAEPLTIPVVSRPLATYREALVGSVQRLNPLLADLNPVDGDITALIFEGLTRSNIYGEPQPLLAQDWLISSDRLEYVFRLREDVLWQDGMPFTAADVVYTVSLLQSPDFPGDPDLGRFWRTVEVQPLNDHVVRFRLTQPLGSFLDALQTGILPEHALRGTTADRITAHPFNLSPIGTGPYQLEGFETSGSTISAVHLRAAPVYRQRSEGQSGFSVERVTFRLYTTFDEALAALQSRAVDGLAARNRSERLPLLNAPGLDIYTALEPTLGAIIFNWPKHSYFREQRVRVALQTGLDRAAIIERHLSNLAVKADSPLIPGSWAYTPDLPWPQPDANAARAILDSARIRNEDGSEITPEPSGALFSFRILVWDDPALVNVAQDVATQWSQLNIDVSVESVDLPIYQARLDSGDFDAALVELSLGDSADPDVYQFWDSGQYPDGKNYGGVNDTRLSDNLERARRDPSGPNRLIYYHDFQHDFIERAIAIPLYYPLYTYATAADVTGVQLGSFVGSPASRFVTLPNWSVLAG